MNRFRLFLIVGLFVAMEVVSAAQDKPSIPLLCDPSAAIITMDWRGGCNVMGPSNGDPILTIRADGRVTVTDPWGNAGNRETVLSSAEIQELLHFAITEQDFFAFNAFDMRQAIETEFRKAGVGVGVSDVPDTIVHIRTANQEHEASFNALSFWAQRYPSIKALVQLRAIELRLTQLVEDIKAGRK